MAPKSHVWYIVVYSTTHPYVRRCSLCGARQTSEDGRAWTPLAGYCSRPYEDQDEGLCARCSAPYRFAIGEDCGKCPACWSPTVNQVEQARRMKIAQANKRDKIMRDTIRASAEARKKRKP